jgi:hypothetical protein
MSGIVPPSREGSFSFLGLLVAAVMVAIVVVLSVSTLLGGDDGTADDQSGT